jgi:hypothetical protein
MNLAAMIEWLIPRDWREQIGRDIFRTPLSYPYRTVSEYLAHASRLAAELHLQAARGPLPRRAVLAAAVVRNEIQRLPAFLAHYRRLGIDRFLLIDNDSSDGSRALLEDQPDVDLWHTRGSYFRAHKGRLWVEAVVQAVGRGHWILNVDADEFLVYDGMDRHDLKDLAALLGRRGERRLNAPMIDVYGRGPLRETPFPAGDPLQHDWWFDADGYSVEESAYGNLLIGGPRTRALSPPERPIALFLQKYPLSRYDAATSYFWIHRPYPYHWNRIPPLGALLHLKFTADFPARVDRAVIEKQHARRSEFYKAYQDQLQRRPDLSFFSPASRRYCGPQSLIDAGIMDAIDWSAPRRYCRDVEGALRHRLHATARALAGASFRSVRVAWRRAARPRATAPQMRENFRWAERSGR